MKPTRRLMFALLRTLGLAGLAAVATAHGTQKASATSCVYCVEEGCYTGHCEPACVTRQQQYGGGGEGCYLDQGNCTVFGSCYS